MEHLQNNAPDGATVNANAAPVPFSEGGAAQSAPATPEPVSDPAAGGGAAAKASKNAIIAIAIITVAVVAAIAIVAAAYLHSVNEQNHRLYAVNVQVNAEGYDPAIASPIPVHIEGTDFENNAVSSDYLIAADGTEPFELMRGTYTLTVMGSPILADGTLYQAPDTAVTIDIVMPEGGTADNVSATVSDALTFTKLDPLTVTDDQINAAHNALTAAGFDSAKADSFKAAATTARDAAVQQEEERKRAEEEARRKAEEEARAKAEAEAQAAAEAEAQRLARLEANAREQLGVPDDPSITCEIDPNLSYWEGVGESVQRVIFYENGKECASGCFILPDGAEGGRTFDAYS